MKPESLKNVAPILARCLDPPFVKNRLHRRLANMNGLHIRHVTIKRFMPRRQGQYDVEYEVVVASGQRGRGRRTRLYGRISQANISPQADIVEPALTRHGLMGVRFDDEVLGATVHSPDQDPELPQFEECLNGGVVGRSLGTGDHARATLISYRPGRRFVAKYEVKDGRKNTVWIGKAFRDGRVERLAEIHEALSLELEKVAGHSIRVPRVHHVQPDLRVMFFECVGPDSGADLDDLPTLARSSGSTMAAIHNASLNGLPSFDLNDHWQTMRRWHDLTVALQPDLAPGMTRLLGELRRARTCLEEHAPSVIHGDFYESQIVHTRKGVTILDLDTLARGDRAVDIGNCLAHLWLWCLRRGIARERYTRAVRAMLERYQASAPPRSLANLTYHWSAALFRVAAIYAFRDGGRRWVPDLLSLAGLMLSEGHDSLLEAKNDRRRPAPPASPATAHLERKDLSYGRIRRTS